MSDSLIRLESAHFDSKFSGYDSDGYPVYDRAVGATMLRTVYARFFSDGIFQQTPDAFCIHPGENGLSITIRPGVGIISGGLGGIFGEDMEVTLSEVSPQGKTPYSVFLRFDNNSEYRSLYIHVVEGEPGSDCVPPEPEIAPQVKELRLGYVILPSDARDMSNAEIVNEQGLSVCPYAAPFMDIDVSHIMSDLYDKTRNIVNTLNERANAIVTDMKVRAMNLMADIRQSAQDTRDILDTTFRAWLGHLQDELDSNQAANLQSQIDSMKYWYVIDETLYMPMTAASIDGDSIVIGADMVEGE